MRAVLFRGHAKLKDGLVCSPASISEHTVSFLEELAGHRCRAAAGQVVGVSTVVAFFAEPMHEIPGNPQISG